MSECSVSYTQITEPWCFTHNELGAVCQLKRELAAAQSKADELRDVLRAIEYSGPGNLTFGCCPMCLQNMYAGHTTTCRIAAAIKEADDGRTR